MTTYRGDSPGKKLTRALVWINAANVLQARFKAAFKGALVLAGHGGDLSALGAIGVDMAKVNAVDLCQEAADFCGELYPSAQTHVGRVGQVASRCTYNVAHLDFCSGLTLENIHAAARVVASMDVEPFKPGYLAITAMRGREPKSQRITAANLPGQRHQRRRMLRHYRANAKAEGMPLWPGAELLEPGVFRFARVLKAVDAHMGHFAPTQRGWIAPIKTASGKLTDFGKCFVRCLAFTSTINMLTQMAGRVVYPVFCMGYQSATKSTDGTPFLTVGFLVADRVKEIALAGFDTTKVYVLDGDEGESTGFALMHFDYMNAAESKASLRGFALSYANDFGTKRAAQLLDLSAGKISAWKAHNTMGAYGDGFGALDSWDPYNKRTLVMHPAARGVGLQASPTVRRLELGWGTASVYVPIGAGDGANGVFPIQGLGGNDIEASEAKLNWVMRRP